MNWLCRRTGPASVSMARSLPAVGDLCGFRPMMLLRSVMLFLVLAAFCSEGASQNDPKNYSLDLSASFVQNRSDCGRGTRGGFLSEDCCCNSFNQYLYALGKKANQTGKVYLNTTEQQDCLPLMEGTFGGISSCGIDRLTRGKGGCSELTVDDVLSKFGDEVKTLDTDCKLLDRGVGADVGCDLCLKGWDALGGSFSKDRSSANISAVVCKFAVLLTLTSTTMMDDKHVFHIYDCLGEHLGDLQGGLNGKGNNNFISIGIWVLMGALIGLVAVALFVLWSFAEEETKTGEIRSSTRKR